MRWDAIMEGFWIFQDSKYGRFLRMQALQKVLNMSEYGWIMPYDRVLNMPEHRVLNKFPVLNMPGFRIWQVVNMWGLHKSLDMPEYALIMP